MAKKNTKATRGRPTIPVSFNFGKGRPFTIDQVLARMKNKISRPAVYNKLMGPKGLVTKRKASVVDHIPVEGRGHPNYRFILNENKVKKAKAVTPAA